MRLGAARVAILAVIATVTAACSMLPSGGPVARLENGTNVPVAIHMDDAWVGTYPPGAVADIRIGPGDGPVVIEARTASGAVLVSFTATESDIAGTTGGASESVLPCGAIRLSMNATELDPMSTPEGPAGTCS